MLIITYLYIIANTLLLLNKKSLCSHFQVAPVFIETFNRRKSFTFFVDAGMYS